MFIRRYTQEHTEPSQRVRCEPFSLQREIIQCAHTSVIHELIASFHARVHAEIITWEVTNHKQPHERVTLYGRRNGPNHVSFLWSNDLQGGLNFVPTTWPNFSLKNSLNDNLWNKVTPLSSWLGEYSRKFLMGVCRPVLQILFLFQTKKWHFSLLFSDLASKTLCDHYWLTATEKIC